MRREGRIWILVLCLLALTAGRVHVVAQEKETDKETKSATKAGDVKAQRTTEAALQKAKRAAEMDERKARLAVEAERRAERANRAEQVKVKRAAEAKRREAPPEGTFKWVGSRLNTGKLVKGAPYSATAVTESTQTLSDGNQIIQRNEATYYRDSEGRTRIEQTLKKIGKWVPVGDPKRIVMIADPVAGHYYSLDTNEHRATKSPLFNRGASPALLHEETERQKFAWEKQRQTFEEQGAKQRQLFEERWEKRTRALEEQRAKAGQVDIEEWARQKRIFEEQRAKEKQTFDEQLAKRKQRFEQELVEKKKRFEDQLARRKQGFDWSPANSASEKSPTKPKPARAPEETPRSSVPKSVNGKKTEELGKRVVEGVEAEGTRTTTTIPAGEIGNTLPIYVIDESWYSRELQVPVMTRHHDPRSGDNVFRLTNINRTEPPRSLFELPADYTILENSRSKSPSPPGEPKIGPKPPSGNLPKPPTSMLAPVKPAPKSQ